MAKDIKEKKKPIAALSAQKKMQVMSELVNRVNLANTLGKQYGTDRDIYTALGYPKDIEYDDYYTKYKRQDIAGAIIKRPVESTWKGEVNLSDSNQDDDKFEIQWKSLMQDLKLKKKFIRTDKLACIGRYSCILLGFNDVVDAELDFQKPVVKGRNLKLIYLNVCAENNAVIKELETDSFNKRYGLPKFYTITISSGENDTKSITVHYSRIIHIIGKSIDDDIYGEPVLMRVWNRLMDLEKLNGGSAEMYWRGAYPGFTADVDKEYTAPADLATTLEDQIKQYEHNLTRVLVNEGVDIKALQQQVSSPKDAVDVQLQMISAETGIPKRILVGSERGELSSTQDKDSWTTLIQTRREEQAEEQIIKPFVETMMEYGILETKEEWRVEWSELNVMSDKDRAEIGKTRSETIKNYAHEPMAPEVMPPAMFLKHILGLPPEVVEEVELELEEYMRMEQELADEIEEVEVVEEPIIPIEKIEK